MKKQHPLRPLALAVAQFVGKHDGGYNPYPAETESD
jgi:hypothetical protein